MKEFQYTIKDACGIHARPAGLLVKTVKGFASTATLEKDGKSCDMRKLMALMGMGVKQGDTVTVKVEVLAPSQRPWQVTGSLESFWRNGYGQMKKDLAGRYPRHRWPDPEELDFLPRSR